MTPQLCYISGKISGLNYQTARMNFVFSAKEVRKYHNVPTLDPFDIEPLFGVKRWLFYMVSDIYALSHCTHIAMRPDWADSRGAVIEYFFSKFVFKLSVIYL